jgi:large subunit ribosomal protein L1
MTEMAGKKLADARKQIDRSRLYSAWDALTLARTTNRARFDATVEVVFRLGVDPRRADQMVRGTVALPHGTGRSVRVAAFAEGEAARQAEEAGADVVGGKDLAERVQGGFLEFDAAVATPDMMGTVGRLGRILGPRGLMPNPKAGTVTPDVARAVREIKGGKLEYRVDRYGNVHLVLGKASFTTRQLVENYQVALEEILRAKPAAAKGRYLKGVAVSTTMGPGIRLDPAQVRNLVPAEEAAG